VPLSPMTEPQPCDRCAALQAAFVPFLERLIDTQGCGQPVLLVAAQRLRAMFPVEGERDDVQATCDRLADLLKRTAIALKGPEPELVMWDWSDLPQRATELRALLAAAEARCVVLQAQIDQLRGEQAGG